MTTDNNDNKLARVYWRSLFRNHEPEVHKSAVESDGRKSDKAVRALVEEGILELKHGAIYLVKKDWAERFTPIGSKPDLAAIACIATRDKYELGQCAGVAWDELSLEELRWVVEHKGDYAMFDAYGKQLPNSWGGFIRDAGFDAAVVARKREIDRDHAVRHNLAWGLRAFGFIEPKDAELFASGERQCWPRRAHTFGPSPEAWEEDAMKRLQQLRDRIAKDIYDANALASAIAKIESKGGWGAFVNEYRKKIDEVIAKRNDKDDKKSE